MITLRKYPYPYKAAFTICSDIDACTWEDFLDIHAFLNTENETPFGEGVSLEIGDSFWFYSDPDTPEHSFSYYNPDCMTPSKYAGAIRHLIRLGWLDVLHSYGNFSEALPFQREYAEQALEECQKENLEISVWVNHGDRRVNTQDFGQYYGKGDDPGNPETYHTDLLTELGVTFFWESEKHVSPVVGQERPVSLKEAWWNEETLSDSIERLKNVVKIANGYQNKLREKLSLPRVAMWEQDPRKNDLYVPFMLRDGQELLRFNRFGHGRYDWSDDIPRLINNPMLRKLITSEGTSILYLHIGDRRDRSQPALTPASVNSLRLLAEKVHKTKDIFVTTTSRLLRYMAVQQYIEFDIVQIGSKMVIELSGIALPQFKDYFKDPSTFQGLTFYTEDPDNTEIRWKNQVLATETNPPDSTGRQSISIPWEPLRDFPIEELRKIKN